MEPIFVSIRLNSHVVYFYDSHKYLYYYSYLNLSRYYHCFYYFYYCLEDQ